MGRPKELSSCAICGDDTPAITRIEYRGQQVPVCNKHRSRIYRYGAKDTVKHYWTEDRRLRSLVGLIVGEGKTYREAIVHFPRSSHGHLTSVMRGWRYRILDEHERGRKSQEQIALEWGLTRDQVRDQIAFARQERDEGKRP